MHLSETLIFILLLVPFILMVIAIIDLIKRNFERATDKVVWILVVVLIPFLGPVAYLLFGRRSAIERKVTG